MVLQTIKEVSDELDLDDLSLPYFFPRKILSNVVIIAIHVYLSRCDKRLLC